RSDAIPRHARNLRIHVRPQPAQVPAVARIQFLPPGRERRTVQGVVAQAQRYFRKIGMRSRPATGITDEQPGTLAMPADVGRDLPAMVRVVPPARASTPTAVA